MLIQSVKLEVQRKEELQMMSNKLAVANDQLRKLDNSKSEFISIASHQLRTPLTAIKGFVSLLLEGSYGKLMDKQEEALNKTYTSTERLINLVEDLLNVSRMESGRMEFKFAPAKMEDLCQEIIDTFVLRAKEKGLYLHYQKPETPVPELMIDAGKVKEVVSNMVDNALKYSPKGGVTLRLERGEFPISNSQFPNNDQNPNTKIKNETRDAVRVIVSDTGIGIPATELPYLFNKFSRGKDIGRLNTGGTGLGLYVGKGMIENNGGKIWAESDGEGKGSRFIIELPVKQSEELLQRWS
jgi:signal transduction histidine kinase